MNRKKITMILLAVLVTLVALGFLAAAFQSYGTLKSIADAVKSNGNFKSLKESNVLIFKILLGSAGLVLLGLAYLIGFGHLQEVRDWLGRLWLDFIHFMKALKPTKADAVPLSILLLIILIAAIFRLAPIYDGMTHDEAYTFVVFGSGSLFNTITNYALPNNHVLNSILVFISTHLFGIQPWTVRLPALVAGLLILPACYAVAKAIYDPFTGLASALLVAILPGAILYSSTARGYSLVALATLLSLWLANYLRGNKNLFAWFLLVLFSALGFYSVPVMLFPFGMVFAWLFLENLVSDPGPYRSKLIFLGYWLSAGIGSAILVLLLYTPIFIYTGADKVFANHWVTPEAWDGYIASIPAHLAAAWQEWTTGLPIVLILLIAAGFVLGLVFHRRIAHQRFPLQLAAFLWLAALLLVQRPIGVQKIWAFLQAPFMIWAAAGITGLLKDVKVKIARGISLAAVVVGIALVIALAGAVQIVPTIPARWAGKGPAEKTVLFIKDQLHPQDLIIIDSPFDAAVWYYSRQYGIPDPRFDKRRPFDRLLVIVDHRDQTLEFVLQDRGPDLSLVDAASAHIIMNYQYLDTYEVPHH